MDWNSILTEERNPDTLDIDTLTTLDMVRRINREDKKVAESVEEQLEEIAKAVDIIAGRMESGGRLVYIGAGTSGRLGVLDAAECPPTFSADPSQVVGLIAGGESAMFTAIEGAEDSDSLGEEDLKRIGFCDRDVAVGIAASGRTPYVIGALKYARSTGAPTIGVSCCPGSEITRITDVSISPSPGPEVITGSTRMKSGTAQKMVLNMLSTCAMIRLGKVYGNLMVDVKASNEKLIHRCERIVAVATGMSEEQAAECLSRCGYRSKTAIVMHLKQVDAAEADRLLMENGGRIAAVMADQDLPTSA